MCVCVCVLRVRHCQLKSCPHCAAYFVAPLAGSDLHPVLELLAAWITADVDLTLCSGQPWHWHLSRTAGPLLLSWEALPSSSCRTEAWPAACFVPTQSPAACSIPRSFAVGND